MPRMLRDGIRAVIRRDSYQVPPIFRLMEKQGEVSRQVMYNTFNMGIGMIVAVRPEDADAAMEAIRESGEDCFLIGTCVSGEKGVELC